MTRGKGFPRISETSDMPLEEGEGKVTRKGNGRRKRNWDDPRKNAVCGLVCHPCYKNSSNEVFFVVWVQSLNTRLKIPIKIERAVVGVQRRDVIVTAEGDSGDEPVQSRERRQLPHVVCRQRGTVGHHETLCWRYVHTSVSVNPHLLNF